MSPHLTLFHDDALFCCLPFVLCMLFLFVCLLVCLFVCLFACLFVCLFVCLIVWLLASSFCHMFSLCFLLFNQWVNG